jgi:Zn-dependent M28 family amino/carboxypeptidase
MATLLISLSMVSRIWYGSQRKPPAAPPGEPWPAPRHPSVYYHGAVRSLIVATTLAAAAVLTAAGPADQWFAHVKFLASDELEGRGAGTPGHRKAAEYVAAQFKAAGLRPLFGNSYFQPVGLRSRRVLRDGTSVTLLPASGAPNTLVIGEDYGLAASIDLSPSIEAQLVFVGYGNYLPEAKLNDTAGVDLKGKIAVYIDGAPNGTKPAERAHASASINRYAALAQAGAAGFIRITDPENEEFPWERTVGTYFEPAMNLTEPGLDASRILRFGMTISPAKAALLFEGSQRKYTDLMRLVELDKPLPHFELPLRLRAAVRSETQDFVSHNVAGYTPATEPVLSREYALITAHLDHLGLGTPVKGDAIYNGAMDNASGVATILEIAKAIGAKPTRRNVIFAAVTAEEEGLLGSQFLATHTNLPRGAIISNLNIDMFLPLYPLQSLFVYGVGESGLRSNVDRIAKRFNIKIDDDPTPKRVLFVRGDQYSFTRAGIPSIFLDFGYKKGSSEAKLQEKWMAERYHQPSDDINQPLDMNAAARFNEIASELARELGDSGERPHWNTDSFFKRFENK